MAPSSRRALATCALYALLSSVFCLPFDAARHPEFQRLPFWMWEYPQAPILTPAWILSALLPASWAIAINLIAHYWIALVGMHLLVTRAIGLRFLPFVVVTSSIFALSGAAALHVAAGDAGFLSLLYLPLILFFVYRSTETGLARHAIGAAALAALT